MRNFSDSDYVVGKITALSMYILVLFLIFQIIVWVAIAVIGILFVEIGIIDKLYQGMSILATFVFAEVIIITGIVLHIRKKYSPFEMTEITEDGSLQPFIFTENYLKWLLNITAVGGIIWILLTGNSINAIKYFLIVIQGFGALFFTIFFIARLIITKQFSSRTFLSIALCCAAVFMALKYKGGALLLLTM